MSAKMVRRWLIAGMVTMLTASGMAQERASFAGTWTAVTGPQRLAIEQSIAQLVVTDARGQKLTYRLDGSESRNETFTVRGEKWTHVSQARWVSSAVVITTTTTREAGQHWDWLTIYRRDGSGNLQVTTLDAVTDPGPFNAMALTTTSYRQAP